MNIIYTGLPSQGKSLSMANRVCILAKRNRKWQERYGFKRYIYSNMIFSDSFMKQYGDLIIYYERIEDLIELTDSDIIIDEVSAFFSSLKSEPLPFEVARWLRQSAKQGNQIFSTVQEFHDVHVQFRRLVSHAYHCTKVIGSGRPSAKTPPVSSPWGAVRVRRLKINPYNEIKPEFCFSLPPFDLTFITRSLCEVFHTCQVIGRVSPPPLTHIERVCTTCHYKKVTHI